MSIEIRYAGHTGKIHTVVPDSFKFSAGEVQVKVNQNITLGSFNQMTIVARISSSDDFMELIMVTDAIRRNYRKVDLRLTLPYLPYSRQDRACSPGEALGVRVFADMINALNFTTVTTYDAHSDVGPACINNCRNIHPRHILSRCVFGGDSLPVEMKNKESQFTLVSPDAGANKKVLAVAKLFGGVDIIHCDKNRDTKTGKITGTKIHCEGTLRHRTLLIVDDICDGGMTFIKIAEVLKQFSAKKIYLYVTHGIFSKGYQPLFDSGISRIYTTDSFKQDLDHPNVFTVCL